MTQAGISKRRLGSVGEMTQEQYLDEVEERGDDTRTVWAVFRMYSWDCLRSPWGPTRLIGSPGCIGFMPVFQRREDAVAFSGGDADVFELREHQGGAGERG